MGGNAADQNIRQANLRIDNDITLYHRGYQGGRCYLDFAIIRS